MMVKSKQEVVQRVSDLLEEEGEMFFSTGSVDDDYKLITETVKAQGFWSGIRYRYFFDKDFNLEDLQDKRYL